MTLSLPDGLLLLVTIEALSFSFSRPALRPVAAALLAYAALALGDSEGAPLWLRRACFAAWGGVVGVLGVAVWKNRTPPP